ncbi:RDD family protein [Cytobacillus purgationiresistens]|uniref:RDD family membrane protein YckC n=1 Tax=Cytobacillus purgationiresistens TaxID=863449 RepID=A0ABU0AMY4_9BACI|nr:RDD family protein [Cytobacillus purgationiresistens]MDQ0272106.1 putative RDD family membrane protein YckC [Cytobacillus purgationiresistens]
MNINDHENSQSSDITLEKTETVSNENELRSEQVPSTPIISHRFAGFWMRVWAYLLDIVVIGSIDRIIINPIFRALDIPLHEMSPFAPITIATALTFYLYFVLMTKFLGQTIGKMAFGLKVIDLKGEKLSWSTVIFREWIGRFISGSIMVFYIVTAFHPKKQGIHDLFADTTVIHER